jgi:peptide chain release factor
METKIIQLTSGRGPAECSWVVGKVLKIYLEEAQKQGIETRIIQKNDGDLPRTVDSVLISCQGKNLEEFLKNWLGTICWKGESIFRKYHKRSNWFVGCNEIENPQTMEFKETDVHYQAIRSSGPGGQHVNKVSSAIRAKHIPTGIQVLVMDSRSQHQNKKLALSRLKEKVKNEFFHKEKMVLKDTWDNHSELERGVPVRIFKGEHFRPIKEKKKSIKMDRQKSTRAIQQYYKE